MCIDASLLTESDQLAAILQATTWAAADRWLLLQLPHEAAERQPRHPY